MRVAKSKRQRQRQIYYQRYKERLLAQGRAYYHCNKQRRRLQNQEWRKNNKAHIIRYKRRYRARTIARCLFREARRRAKRLALPFNLTMDDIVVPEYCPVFGIKLQIATGHSTAASPTLDRIDPRIGYKKGNVAVISQFANVLKGKATAAQHQRIAIWMDSVKKKGNGHE